MCTSVPLSLLKTLGNNGSVNFWRHLRSFVRQRLGYMIFITIECKRERSVLIKVQLPTTYIYRFIYFRDTRAYPTSIVVKQNARQTGVHADQPSSICNSKSSQKLFVWKYKKNNRFFNKTIIRYFQRRLCKY